MFSSYIECVSSGKSLTLEESRACSAQLFSGTLSTDDAAAFLEALAIKGESVEEVVGFAQVMREKMNVLELNGNPMDLCGTGGVLKDRFNTSTAASFLVAAAGGAVAKHGNRGSRKANGSFDFLEALGIPIVSDVKTLQSIFASQYLCFLFARFFHPAVAAVAEARKRVGRRTIFNLLGPLCNPARVSHQIIGTLGHAQARLLSEAILQLGTTQTTVIVSEDGVDELSPFALATLYKVNKEGIQKVAFHPEDCGISLSPMELGFSDSVQNAALFCEVLSNNDSEHPVALAIALNAGLALYNSEYVGSIRDGFFLVQQLIKSGQGWAFFMDYKDQNNRIFKA